ncbi:MAG TPA: RDD family protein [Acidimicrobiales bacterium]|nr:RDD family protein [Acidimicrobiales bacterium]
MYRDPASGLFLPNGTQLASGARRIGAWFLAIPLSIITLGIGYLIWGAIIWGRGQTPALQVLGMRCWRPETGRVATWWWMALREIVGRLVDGILSVITLLISFIMMLAGAQRKTLHDMVAGTVVLYDPNKVLGR